MLLLLKVIASNKCSLSIWFYFKNKSTSITLEEDLTFSYKVKHKPTPGLNNFTLGHFPKEMEKKSFQKDFYKNSKVAFFMIAKNGNSASVH